MDVLIGSDQKVVLKTYVTVQFAVATMCTKQLRAFTQYLLGRRHGGTGPAVLAMLHVPALPGTPLCTASFEDTLQHCQSEAIKLANANVDGIIIENMHDLPYTTSIGPETVAFMACVCQHVKRALQPDHPQLKYGVQVLAQGNQHALAVAAAAGLDFIRAECLVYAHVADEGWMNAQAGPLLRYARHIDAQHIAVLTDINKKHASHHVTHDISLVDQAKAAQFFLADGVIVTGTSTGVAAEPSECAQLCHLPDLPVLVGSGVTADNIDKYWDTQGVIVGSHLKRDGLWHNDIDQERLSTFMHAVRTLRKQL